MTDGRDGDRQGLFRLFLRRDEEPLVPHLADEADGLEHPIEHDCERLGREPERDRQVEIEARVLERPRVHRDRDARLLRQVSRDLPQRCLVQIDGHGLGKRNPCGDGRRHFAPIASESERPAILGRHRLETPQHAEEPDDPPLHRRRCRDYKRGGIRPDRARPAAPR